MPKVRLTAAAVDRVKAPVAGQVEYFDTHLPAFGLRVSYSGTKAWFVTTRVDRKLARITLGRHPAMSLAEAREKARVVVEQAKNGTDPRQFAAEERRRKEEERQTTFGGVAALFMERYVERELRPNTAREYRRILLGPDTEQWRTRPVTSIAKRDIVDLLHGMEERGSPAAANRALAYLSKFFNWCLEQDLITANPAARVRALSSAKSRERVLTIEELTWIWRALDGFPGVFAPLFKILLLTGQRRSEVGGMRWEEVRGLGSDRPIWDLPAERTKNGQPHLVPLAPACRPSSHVCPDGAAGIHHNEQHLISGFSKLRVSLINGSQP
jgi:integrase